MNAIMDMPVKTQDVDIAEKIFGPDLGTLKGKTTRQKPLPMVNDRIAIPPELYENRDSLELCMDIMFVNGMPFLTTITRALYYRTANYLLSRQKENLYSGLDEVLRMYNSNGFYIEKIYCDNEFRSIMDEISDTLEGITLKYSPSKAHVPEAERNNRVLKERIRAAFHRLPLQSTTSIGNEDACNGKRPEAKLLPSQIWHLPALQSSTDCASGDTQLQDPLPVCFGQLCPGSR